MIDLWFCIHIIMYTKIANNVKDFLTDRKGEEICWMVSQVCKSLKFLQFDFRKNHRMEGQPAGRVLQDIP